jgi:hypothetical protein
MSFGLARRQRACPSAPAARYAAWLTSREASRQRWPYSSSALASTVPNPTGRSWLCADSYTLLRPRRMAERRAIAAKYPPAQRYSWRSHPRSPCPIRAAADRVRACPGWPNAELKIIEDDGHRQPGNEHRSRGRLDRQRPLEGWGVSCRAAATWPCRSSQTRGWVTNAHGVWSQRCPKGAGSRRWLPRPRCLDCDQADSIGKPLFLMPGSIVGPAGISPALRFCCRLVADAVGRALVIRHWLAGCRRA